MYASALSNQRRYSSNSNKLFVFYRNIRLSKPGCFVHNVEFFAFLAVAESVARRRWPQCSW